MSWLYSRALVEEFSAATCSDGARSALSSGSHTPQAFLPSDKMTDFSRHSRFGMTFKPLTDDLGADVLTWFLAGFPAKTSASPEKAQASAANDPGCGPTWRGSLARFDPATSSWRTVQPSLLGDSDECSVTWPRSGMTADGQCWELPMLGRRTSATDSGLWVPTPIRNDAEKRGNFDPVRSWGLAGFVKLWPTPFADDAVDRKMGKWNSRGEPKLSAMVKLWPTPVASDTSSRSKPYAQGGTPLSLAVKYPTPSTIGINGGIHSRATALKRGQSSAELNGGSLNPTWVEWLMGWPLGWTDLEPLATDKYLNAPLKRGAC